MSESVVADFTTDVIPEASEFSEPVRGRIVMSKRRMVIATPDSKWEIQFSDIFDIAYGSAPQELRQFFEDTVRVAYETDDGRHIALIESGDETVSRFTDLLFKAVLNGTSGWIKHPARIGGRITDNSMRPTTVYLRPGTVYFNGDQQCAISVSTVSHFERRKRPVAGEERPVLSVRHMEAEMQSMTSEIALESSRKMNILGRFLRIEYSQLREELAEMEVRDQEVEALVGLYSGGADASLASLLGMEANQVTMLLNALREKGLIEESESGMAVTPIGKLAVSSKIEQVNM